MNALTKQDCLYIDGNKTVWGHQGWGETQSGIARIILNNSGVLKIGKVVSVYDVGRIWLCYFVRRHKFWEISAGFTLKDTNYVRMILYNDDNIIIGECRVETGKTSKIFKKKPGLCWENYFYVNKKYLSCGE